MEARQFRTYMTVVILFAITLMSGNSPAAEGGSEIELKELRSAAPRTAPRQGPQTPAASATGSSYIIRPGDHLFLILTKRYGLSSDAAERLIPEIMRLNRIRSPKGLTVGERLTIPLLPRTEVKGHTTGKKAPKLSCAVRTEPEILPPATATSAKRSVTVTAASPCAMAYAIIERLNLLAPNIAELSGSSGFTAHHAGLTVVVTCGLPPAEAYTYARLLAGSNADLLVFPGDESPGRVVGKLASHLGLSHQLLDQHPSAPYPLTYLFNAVGPGKEDVRLTIIEEKECPEQVVR
jgi:hypothetical protein